MKEQILKLRQEGKSYTQIQKELGCSKGTISYHCGEGQKEKYIIRRKKFRDNNKLRVKTFNFKCRKPKNIIESIRKFQKTTRDRKIDTSIEKSFTWKDIINKFGENTECYLTGDKINLIEGNFTLDHIIPVSKGGDNSFSNLGIASAIANRVKTDQTMEELISLCIKILNKQGYTINKCVQLGNVAKW